MASKEKVKRKKAEKGPRLSFGKKKKETVKQGTGNTFINSFIPRSLDK